MSQDFYVYIHKKPNGDIFYVGKGKLARVKLLDRVDNTHHTRILSKYGKPNIKVCSMLCKDEQHALSLEVRIIAALRAGGVKLCNITDGGEGVTGYVPTQKHREAASANLKKLWEIPENRERFLARLTSSEHKKAMRSYIKTPEALRKRLKTLEESGGLEKFSSKQRELWSDPAHRTKRVASMVSEVATQKRKESLEKTREQRSIRMKNLWADPERREILEKGVYSEKRLAVMQTEEYRDKMRAIASTQEAKEQKSKLFKSKWEDPEYRNKMMEMRNSPEYKEKMRKIQESPEYRKKLSDAQAARSKQGFHTQETKDKIKATKAALKAQKLLNP